ncbi:MAG TPA: hypothetical protein VGO07_05775 [Candidatus Saccharimonadales bacterium]|jgi:hypothetical protein|nr:hypothetical protein [Candidatus Saccharimonadales bacterium]
MAFSTQMLQAQRTLLVPKGRNRAAATNWLLERGIDMPALAGRRLHRS